MGWRDEIDPRPAIRKVLASKAVAIAAPLIGYTPLGALTGAGVNAVQGIPTNVAAVQQAGAFGTGALTVSSKDARQNLGDTWGKYVVTGIDKYVPGSGGTIAGLAASGGFDGIPFFQDIADGFAGELPTAGLPTLTGANKGPYTPSATAGPVGSMSPLMIGALALGGVLLVAVVIRLARKK